MKTRIPTAEEFTRALKNIDKPRDKRLQFLQNHYHTPGRVCTARLLAESVGYTGHGGVNLWYGKLARQIAEVLRVRNPGQWLSLLVQFANPPALTNRECILVMRQEFAEALRAARWV